MSYHRLWIRLGLGLCAGLVLASQASAVAPEIKDQGKFFSEEAVKKANKQIREIARKYEKDLLIETFATIPADQAARVKSMSNQEREKFFHNWAEDRAETAVVNGIYVLVCKDPAHLQIVVTKKARSRFDDEAYKKLRDLLLKEFRAKHFDEGLQATVNFVQEKLAASESK